MPALPDKASVREQEDVRGVTIKLYSGGYCGFFFVGSPISQEDIQEGIPSLGRTHRFKATQMIITAMRMNMFQIIESLPFPTPLE